MVATKELKLVALIFALAHVAVGGFPAVSGQKVITEVHEDEANVRLHHRRGLLSSKYTSRHHNRRSSNRRSSKSSKSKGGKSAKSSKASRNSKSTSSSSKSRIQSIGYHGGSGADDSSSESYYENSGDGGDGGDEGRSCNPPTDIMTPVVSERNNGCSYEMSQTVRVSAPVQPDVEKKLSGGTSAYDGSNAVIVSFNSEGSAGAVWSLTKKDGQWEQSGILQTFDEDQLGWSVSIKGSTYVVGAPGYEGNDVASPKGFYWAGRGKAIVLGEENNGEWVEQGVLLPGVADDDAAFGNAVDIAECECLIAVGAWHDRFSRGSVHIFEKDDTGKWNEIQKLAPKDTRRSQSGGLHGNYGYSVAIDDDYLAVKAPYDSYTDSLDEFDPDRGVVYVYRRGSTDGQFREVARLCTPEGAQVRQHLKDLIFLDDFLLVGAPGMNKVYVYERLGDGYERTAELMPSDGTTEESNFGIRLDGKGTNVMVEDFGSEVSYQFTFEDGVWKEKAKFNSVITSLSGNSIVDHNPKSFAVSGEQYGGDVSFFNLVCDR